MRPTPRPPTKLRALFRALRGLYFRDVWMVGDRPPAHTRGTVFVANHPNGLLDPVVVLTELPCHAAPLAKSTLWQVPGLRQVLNAAGAVPVLRKQDKGKGADSDNDAMFARVAEHLVSGGNILLFPEGISHDETSLQELRSGAARMVARAWEVGGRDVGFAPLALHYDAKDLFRSRVLIAAGPRQTAADYVDASGAPNVQQLRDAMRDGLRHLLLETDNAAVFHATATYAEMSANDSGTPSAVQVYTHAKALNRPPTAGLLAYAAALAHADISDTEVCILHKTPQQGDTWVQHLFGLVGAVLYVIPYRLVGRLATRTAKGERDVVSTYKLGLGFLLFSLWWLLLVLVLAITLPWAMAVTGAVVCTLAPLAALRWLDSPAGKLRARRITPGELWSQRSRALAEMLADDAR